MKLNKIPRIGLYALFFILLHACNSDDDAQLFDQAPSARIDARLAELKNLLTSKEAYKTIYFTKDDEFGGFTFYMQFNEDNTVVMTSDVNENRENITSEYEVKLGTTVELVFSTRSHIHKLSDSSTAGLIGSGYEGNSSFQFVGADENGIITFKDIRNDATLRFEPATLSDFSKVEESFALRSKLDPTKSDISVFINFQIISGGTTMVTELNFDALRLFASPAFQNQDGTIQDYKFGVAFTESGLIASPPIEINGDSYEEFTFNQTTSAFVSEVNGNRVIIGSSDSPPFFNNDVLQMDDSVNLAEFALTRGVSPLTSLGMLNLIKEIDNGPTMTSLSLKYSRIIFFFDGFTSGQDFTVQFRFRQNGGAEFSANYRFSGEIRDNLLFLTYKGTANGNANLVENDFMPFIEYLSSQKGLYFVDQGGFRTSTQNFGGNKSFSLTSLDQPNLRFYALVYN